MKRHLKLMVILIFFYSGANSQTMPTIGEIYDFEIDDEFHYSISESWPSPNWPNVKRHKIIDKYYSATNDTVFYTRKFNNYTGTYNFSTGQMEYFFSAYIDKIFYTNLNTLINARYANEYTDSCNYSSDALFYNEDLCNTFSYKHWRCVGCCFEGRAYTWIYSIGLGLPYIRDYYPSEFHEKVTELFYFKKGIIECGTPSLLAVSVNKPIEGRKVIDIYPNPARNEINFEAGFSKSENVTIFNSLGTIVLNLNNYTEGPINIGSLKEGFYFGLILTDSGTHSFKFIKSPY